MKQQKSISSGRIMADGSKLVPTGSYSIPEYYEDHTFICVDCKDQCVFTKEQQRDWYEEYGIPHYALRNRCKHCEKKLSERKILRTRYREVATIVNAGCADAKLLGEFGKLAVEIYECPRPFHSNRLQDAIAALRRSLKINPQMTESIYWLGRCYKALNRCDDAKKAFARFLAEAETLKGVDKLLLKDAQTRIANCV